MTFKTTSTWSRELSDKETLENFQKKIYLHNQNFQKKKRSKTRRFLKDELSIKKKNKRKRNKTKKKQRIPQAKESELDQNPINLSSISFISPRNSLLAKEPSFIPTPTDINC